MSQPFFVRSLTRSEKRRVQELRRKPPSTEVYRRVQAVHFSSRGLKAHEIALIVDRSRVTVTRWLHDFHARGTESLWPGKSTGRPPKADADFQAALSLAVEQNPRDLGYPFTRWTADLLTEHLRRETHVDVSSSTVCKTLKRLGYRYGRPKLDLKHRQDPKDVARANRQKRAALKKRKPAPVVVLSRMSTKPSFTSTRDCRPVGLRLVVG
jgi:transposase